MSPIIRVGDLRVCRAGKTICHVPELHIQHGERVGVVGINGSGKTTLLRVLAGLENDYTGQCRVDVDLRRCVYVHQAPFLFRGTVLFNTTYGMAARGVARKKRIAQARDWLARLNVAHLVNRKCKTLSGGERRRVALARALATEPELLLLDEALTDLDSEGVGMVARVIREDTRQTVLIASPVPLPEDLVGRTCTVTSEDAV